MVELQLPKLTARVRFPSPAPMERHSGYKESWLGREVSGVAFSLFWGGFRGVGAWAHGALEQLPVRADRSLGGVSQGLARCAEAGSVK